LTLEATGVLTGPVDLAEQVIWGPLRLWQQDGRIRFEMNVEIDDRPAEEMEVLVQRVGPAVRAAVAAASGAAVDVDVSGWSYPTGELRRVGSTLRTGWAIHVSLQADTAPQAESALKAVLGGSDPRLADLYEVYLLGVQAVQTIAPVVGLWAFATVLEEDSPSGKSNLQHLPALAEQLRAEGQAVPPTPERKPDRIRAAALHPTPKDPLPTAEEVAWFQELAMAYLVRRASRGPQR
jgi:hypothetical protein